MATVPTLARKVMDVDSIFEDLVNVTEDAYTTALEELVEVGYLIAGYDEVEDRKTFYAKEGMSWSQVSGTNVSELSCPVKKQILLCLIENPTTFFVLYNTQKGKMRIAANEMRSWAAAPNLKVVAFLIVDNDKTLADQSADGVTSIVAGVGTVFLLSSNSDDSLDAIKNKIDSYGAFGGTMPVVVALKNPTQMKKVVALMAHIKSRMLEAKHGEALRYGVVFDEADKIYPQARDQFKPLLVDDNQALHRLGFVTATEGTLMDEDYPECANAYMYPVTSGSEYYRAFHTEGAVIKEARHYVKDSNDVYAENILRDNAEHFAAKIALADGTMSYRKVIVNSGVKTGSMEGFALRRTAANCYAITVNQNGVTVYRPGYDKVRRSTKGVRFGQLLFNLYGELALHDKPLFIIGRRKVDRGLGFHHAPSDKSAGLVWTDMILGRVDDKNTAVQKAGRLAGIVAHCPQYPGKLTWWTDAATAAIIKRHNSVVDKTNTLRGCSALQSVTRAEVDVPAAPVVVGFRLSARTFATAADAKIWWKDPASAVSEPHDVRFGITKYNIYDRPEGKCIKYRGGLRKILTETAARGGADLNQGLGTSARIVPVVTAGDIQWGIASHARIMPVVVGQDLGREGSGVARIMPVESEQTIRYIVVYKPDAVYSPRSNDSRSTASEEENTPDSRGGGGGPI